MRVLMISKAVVVGAYQRKLEEMARHTDLDLTVVVPPVWDDPSGPLRLERAHLEGYRLLVEPLRFNGNFHLHFYPTLARHMRQIRPDVVHIDEEPYNLSAWQAFWLARRVGARTLFFSWQNLLRRYPPPFSWGERWMLRGVDAAIFGTQGAAEIWRQKGYRGRMAVIPQFGVDPAIFRPVDPVESVRPPDADPVCESVVGYAGRLVPEKGVDLLIRAAARLRERGRRLCVRVVGQGPERAALENLAAECDLPVTFVGQMPSTQMPGFYAQCDVLAVPSRTLPNWKEQFGRVLIEAMACGLPVVGSDSGAIPDVVGAAGLIFPEDDADALAARLDAALYDPALRADLIERGRAHVYEKFTHARIAEQTVALYRELVGTRGDA